MNRDLSEVHYKKRVLIKELLLQK